MATLLDVATTVTGNIKRSGLLSEAKVEVSRTIEALNRKPYAFSELMDGEITTVSGTQFYPTVDFSSASGVISNAASMASTPVSDILGIDWVEIVQGGQRWGLDEISYRDLRRLVEGVSETSVPGDYTRYAGRIGFWPTPGAVYTVYISARVKAPVPTADSDTSVWFNQALELVENYVAARVLAKHVSDDAEAAKYLSMATALESDLSYENAMQSGTGRVMPETV